MFFADVPPTSCLAMTICELRLPLLPLLPRWLPLAALIRPIEPEVSFIVSPLCQSCLRFPQKHKTQGPYIKDMAVRSLAYHNETSNRGETLEQGPKSLFFHGVHGVPLPLGIRCSHCSRYSRCAGFDKCCLRLLKAGTRTRVSGKYNRCVLVTLLITLKKQESPPPTE